MIATIAEPMARGFGFFIVFDEIKSFKEQMARFFQWAKRGKRLRMRLFAMKHPASAPVITHRFELPDFRVSFRLSARDRKRSLFYLAFSVCSEKH
jgi:hypothetical protein